MIAIGKGKLGNGELLVRDNYLWFLTHDTMEEQQLQTLHSSLFAGLQCKITRLVVNDALIWEVE